MFQNAWQELIWNPVKTRDRYAELFWDVPTRAGGIRLFAKYEQIAELFEVTPEKIMDVIVWFIDHSVS